MQKEMLTTQSIGRKIKKAQKIGRGLFSMRVLEDMRHGHGCLRFVANAYGLSNAGFGRAIDAWNNNGSTFDDRETDDDFDEIPEGALVFFGATIGVSEGHVGICISDGKMMHVWPGGVRKDDIKNFKTHYAGWRWPDAWTDDEPVVGESDLDVSYLKARFKGQSSWRKNLVLYVHETKTIQLKTKVDNDGEAEADKDEFEVEYYFSTNRDFDDDRDRKIGDDSVNYDLEPEGEDDDSDTEEMEISSSAISQLSTPGTYYFFIYIDSDLEEEHNSNNTSNDGSGSDEHVKITVLATPAPPVADFHATPTGGDRPLAVSFTDQSNNNPTSWNWSFGNGSNSTSQNPSHTYTETGVYTVTLNVTNQDGTDSEIKTNYIVVTEPPPPVPDELKLNAPKDFQVIR